MNDLIKYLEEIFCRKGIREIIVPIRPSQLNYFKIEYNIDTSAEHPTLEGDDIVRTILKNIELPDKEQVR